MYNVCLANVNKTVFNPCMAHSTRICTAFDCLWKIVCSTYTRNKIDIHALGKMRQLVEAYHIVFCPLIAIDIFFRIAISKL